MEVTPSVIGRLREQKVAAGNSAPHELVFTSRTGSGHDHRNIGGRVLARAVKRAGLEAVEDRYARARLSDDRRGRLSKLYGAASVEASVEAADDTQRN